MAKGTSKLNTVLLTIAETAQRFGWIVVGVLMIVLTVSAIGARDGAHIEKVTPIIEPLTSGETLLTEAELLEVLANSFTKPMDQLKLSDIDVELVEEVLEGQPFIAEADAYIDDDLHLTVRVTQRVPLLRVITGEGQNYFFDENGVRMPLSETYTPRVPVATGFIVPWTNNYREQEESQLADLVALARYLRTDPFLDALIEQIDVQADGQLVLAPKLGDQLIELGRYDKTETPARLQRLKTFYREGLPYEGWRKYRSFDLRFDRQVVARKR